MGTRLDALGQAIHNHGHGFTGTPEIHLLNARFAVDAKPQFSLASGNALFPGRTRNGAAVQ